MELYEAIAEVQIAATQYANVIDEHEETSSYHVDRLAEALTVTNDFLKLLRGYR